MLGGWAEGHNTRYMDCCKPSCAWAGHADAGKHTRFCHVDGVTVNGDMGAQSSCAGGWRAYTCFDQAPWRDPIDHNLSYGFVAVPAAAASCGHCYEMAYTGSGGFYRPDDVGSRRLRGKRMVVMASNIGYDVFDGQFDLMVPGGGVGLFDACSRQWTPPHGAGADMGATYGGFLSRCQQQIPQDPDPEAVYEVTRECVRAMCNAAFRKPPPPKGYPSLAALLEPCLWFVSWYEAADNPNFIYREVACPQAIHDRAGTWA